MGKRLQLRLTTACNNHCVHCTLQDIRDLRLPDRPIHDIYKWLDWGRAKHHCDEVVLLRGEATIRPDIGRVCRYAQRLGYSLVQVQSNGRRFADPSFTAYMARCGMTDAEVDLYGSDATLHDTLARTPGAFEQTLRGWDNLLAQNLTVRVNIPLLSANLSSLTSMIYLVSAAGIRDIQLHFVRPVSGSGLAHLTTLNHIRLPVFSALALGSTLGLRITTEAIPFCVLGTNREHATDADSPAHFAASTVVVDLHRTVTDLNELRAEYRQTPAICTTCRWVESCPKTWTSYVELHGEEELRPESL